MMPGLGKDFQCPIHHHTLSTPQILLSDIRLHIKWAVSLLTAYGYFDINILQYFAWVCVSQHIHSISPLTPLPLLPPPSPKLQEKLCICSVNNASKLCLCFSIFHAYVAQSIFLLCHPVTSVLSTLFPDQSILLISLPHPSLMAGTQPHQSVNPYEFTVNQYI